MNETVHKRIIIALVAAALFMEMLDGSIINTALPHIAQSFGEEPITLRFAVTSYFLCLAIFIPICGWMADRFGTQKIFCMSIGLFILSSLFCGLSNDLISLTLFRGIQGFSGALMTPVARMIMVRQFPPQELVKVTTYVFLPVLIGPLLGPVVGGFFATYYSWRMVFFVNIPIGIVLLLCARKFVKNDIAEQKQKLDILGFFLVGVGLCLTSLGFECLTSDFISRTNVFIILGSGLLLLLAFFFYSSKKKENAVLDMTLFRVRTFNFGILGSISVTLVVGGGAFLMPLLFQLQFGMTPFRSGLFLVPFACGALLSRFFVGRLLKRMGVKNTLILGVLGNGLSYCAMGFVSLQTPEYLILLNMFLMGVFSIILFATNGPLVYSDIPRNKKTQATALDATLRQFTMSMAIGTSALLLIFYSHNIGTKIHIEGAIQAFHYAFFTLVLFFILQIVICFKMNNDDGKSLL